MATAPSSFTESVRTNQVSNGAEPRARQVFSFPLILVGAAVLIDLKSAANLHNVSNVQGIFIDNSNGTASLGVTTVAGMNLSIPAGWQCLMPLFLSADNTLTFTGNGTVNLTLLNFRTPAMVWPGTASATASVVTISGTPTVVVASPPLTASAPANFSIVTGGTALNVFNANTIVHGAVIKNPGSAVESLYVDLVNPAQLADPGTLGTCMGIGLGETYIVPGNMTGAVSVNAATTGHTFSAWSY
jgi:hypothetical protein